MTSCDGVGPVKEKTDQGKNTYISLQSPENFLSE